MVSQGDEDKFDKDLVNEGYCVKRHSLWYNKLVPDHKSDELCMPQYSILINHKLQREQIIKQLLSNTLHISQEHANAVYYQCNYCSCESTFETTNFLFSHLVKKEHVEGLFDNVSKDFVWIYTVTYCPPCKLLILGDQYVLNAHKHTAEHTSKMPAKHRFKRNMKPMRDANDDSDEDTTGTLPTYERKSNKRNSFALKLDDIILPPSKEVLPEMLEDGFCNMMELLNVSKDPNCVDDESNVNNENLPICEMEIFQLADTNKVEQINKKQEYDKVNKTESEGEYEYDGVIRSHYNPLSSFFELDSSKNVETQNDYRVENVAGDRHIAFSIPFTLKTDKNLENGGENEADKIQNDVGDHSNEQDSSVAFDNGKNEENQEENDGYKVQSDVSDHSNEQDSTVVSANGKNEENLEENDGNKVQSDVSGRYDVHDISCTLDDGKNIENRGENNSCEVQNSDGDQNDELKFTSTLNDGKVYENQGEIESILCGEHDSSCKLGHENQDEIDHDHRDELNPSSNLDCGKSDKNQGEIESDHCDELDPSSNLCCGKSNENEGEIVSDRCDELDSFCKLGLEKSDEGNQVETASDDCDESTLSNGVADENQVEIDSSRCGELDHSCTLDGDVNKENLSVKEDKVDEPSIELDSLNVFVDNKNDENGKENNSDKETDVGGPYNELNSSSTLDIKKDGNEDVTDCDALVPSCKPNIKNDNNSGDSKMNINKINSNASTFSKRSFGYRKSDDNNNKGKFLGNNIDYKLTNGRNGRSYTSIQIKGKNINNLPMETRNCTRRRFIGVNFKSKNNGYRIRETSNSGRVDPPKIPILVSSQKLSDNNERITNGINGGNDFQKSVKMEHVSDNKEEEKQDTIGSEDSRRSYRDCVKGNKINTEINNEPSKSQMNDKNLSENSNIDVCNQVEKKEEEPDDKSTNNNQQQLISIAQELNTNDIQNGTSEKNDDLESDNPITTVVYGIPDRLLDDRDSLEGIFKQYAKVQRTYIYAKSLHMILENRDAIEQLHDKKDQLQMRLGAKTLNIIEVTVMKKFGDVIKSDLTKESIVMFSSMEMLDYEIKDLILCCRKLTDNASGNNRRVEKLRWSVYQVAKKCMGPARKVACHVFGSRITGIALENSDVDIYVEIDESFYGKNGTDRAQQVELVRIFADAMSKIPEFHSVKAITQARVPIVHFWHNGTKLTCDLSFKSGIGVLNSTLVRTYFNLDCRAKIVLVGVKSWAKKNYLIRRNLFNTYSLTCMVFFFMMYMGLLPSVLKLRSILPLSMQSYLIEGWNCTFPAEADARNLRTFIPAQPLLLLKAFFKFYSDEALQNYTLSTLLGSAVPKDHFLLHWANLPPYYCELKRKIQEDPELLKRMYLDFDGLCVQDPFEHSYNVTKTINKEKFGQFRILCDKTHAIMSQYC